MAFYKSWKKYRTSGPTQQKILKAVFQALQVLQALQALEVQVLSFRYYMDLQTYKEEKWAQGMVTACIVHSSPETGGKQEKDSSKRSSAFAVLGTLQTYSSLWVFVLALLSAWGTLTLDLRMYCSIPPWRYPLFQRYFLRETFPSWIKKTPPIIFKPSLCFALNYLPLQQIICNLTLSIPLFDLASGDLFTLWKFFQLYIYHFCIFYMYVTHR